MSLIHVLGPLRLNNSCIILCDSTGITEKEREFRPGNHPTRLTKREPYMGRPYMLTLTMAFCYDSDLDSHLSTDNRSWLKEISPFLSWLATSAVEQDLAKSTV